MGAGRRRLAWAGVAAAGVLLWLGLRGAGTTEPSTPVVPVEPQAAGLPAVAISGGAVLRGPGPSSPAPAMRADEPLAAHCGLGPAAAAGRAAPEASDLNRLAERLSAQARRQVQDALMASADEADRATGLWLSMTGFAAGGPAGFEEPGGHGDRSGAGEARLRQLAALAADTRAPHVYALALQACQGSGLASVEPACTALSETRWVALDPDNMAAWLALAQQAGQQGDEAGVHNAMWGASRAPHMRLGQPEVLRRVQAVLPAPARGWPAVEVSAAALSAGYSLPMSGLISVMGHCRPDQMQDANRQQVCATLADRLLLTADNLMDLGVAVRLAERSGLPGARVAEARERLDAAYWVQDERRRERRGRAAAALQGDCTQVLDDLQHLATVAREGELPAMQRQLGQVARRTGLSPAEMARRWREQQAAGTGRTTP